MHYMSTPYARGGLLQVKHSRCVRLDFVTTNEYRDYFCLSSMTNPRGTGCGGCRWVEKAVLIKNTRQSHRMFHTKNIYMASRRRSVTGLSGSGIWKIKISWCGLLAPILSKSMKNRDSSCFRTKFSLHLIGRKMNHREGFFSILTKIKFNTEMKNMYRSNLFENCNLSTIWTAPILHHRCEKKTTPHLV